MNRKKTAKAALAALGLNILMPAAAMAATDTQGHWAEGVLTKWETKNLIAGYEDGTIRPDVPISRAEFVSLVNRVGNFNATGSAVTFRDVTDEDWYSKQVAIAVNAGFIGGFEDNTFRAGEYVTRAQAASMIARFENLTADPERADLFADKDQTPDWAKGVVGAVANAGYMIGDEKNCFHAQKPLTRAEAVAALDRIFKVQGSDNTVTIVMANDKISVPADVEKELLSIKTIVNKYASAGEKDATTYVIMPDTLKVTAVTLPAGSNFDTTYGDKVYEMTLIKDLTKTCVEDITVKDVLDVIDPDSEAAETLKKLEPTRVLIACEQSKDGNLHWYVDGKTWQEQVIVFEMLEITFAHK